MILRSPKRCTFAEWQLLCETFGRYLSDQEAHQLHFVGKSALLFYTASAWQAAGQSELHWHILPKSHLFNEMQEDVPQEKYNPRFYHNFQGEDMMKSVKKLVHLASCAKSGMELNVLRRSLVRIAANRKQLVSRLCSPVLGMLWQFSILLQAT